MGAPRFSGTWRDRCRVVHTRTVARTGPSRRIAPTLTRRDLEGHSFYDLLTSRYGITVAAGTQTIEPTVTNDEEAAVLGVPVHAPAFLFERTSTSDKGEVVEFVRSIYRGDRYRLVTELRPALRDR
jgi:GntR family transcriptional regulator